MHIVILQEYCRCQSVPSAARNRVHLCHQLPGKKWPSMYVSDSRNSCPYTGICNTMILLGGCSSIPSPNKKQILIFTFREQMSIVHIQHNLSVLNRNQQLLAIAVYKNKRPLYMYTFRNLFLSSFRKSCPSTMQCQLHKLSNHNAITV
jgi:hypothetical protein